MVKKKYNVGGFLFDNENDAKAAESELKGIEYMKERTDLSNVDATLASYNMINEKKLFKTPIGICYLRELRASIIEKGVLEEDVPPINIDFVSDGNSKKKKTSEKETIYKSRFINMIIVNVLLIVMLVLFAIIANNSKNINIINYKNRIDAEYKDLEINLSQWSQELIQKEKRLNELEKLLEGN